VLQLLTSTLRAFTARRNQRQCTHVVIFIACLGIEQMQATLTVLLGKELFVCSLEAVFTLSTMPRTSRPGARVSLTLTQL
jgi:hypothetical protein